MELSWGLRATIFIEIFFCGKDMVIECSFIIGSNGMDVPTSLDFARGAPFLLGNIFLLSRVVRGGKAQNKTWCCLMMLNMLNKL